MPSCASKSWTTLTDCPWTTRPLMRAMSPIACVCCTGSEADLRSSQGTPAVFACSSRFPMYRPTAVIAEDEPLLRRELKDALVRLWPELDVIAEVGDGLQAIQALSARKPDVIFLDIQMPGMTGI